MSRPRLSSLGIALTIAADIGRRAQQPFLEQTDDRLELGEVAVVSFGVGLVVPSDLLARQAAAAGQQIVAVAGQEIVGLAQHDLQAMPLELHVVDDLGLEQADGVACRRIAEARQEFVGHRRAADSIGGLEHGDLEALLRQIISAGQAVVTGADNDRVVQMSPATGISASARVLRPWSDEAQPSRRNPPS